MKSTLQCITLAVFHNALAYSPSMTPSVSSLHYFSLLLNYRETSKLCVIHWLGYQLPILLDCAQKGAQRHSPRTLINAHSPWLPARFTRFPWLPRSRVLVSRLSILPENISTFEAQTCRGCREKRWTRICGQTHTRTNTHTHTHRLSTITLARACAARVNYSGTPDLHYCLNQQWKNGQHPNCPRS